METGAGSTAIQKEDVLTIARLAHLDLDEDEVLRMTRELARILTYVQQLDELDLEGVPPTAHVQLEAQVLRKDELVPSLPHELALLDAPEVQDQGFAVPAFVDEG